MAESVRPYQRGGQILRILKSYGPLSLKGISEIIAPAMKERRLQDSLKRLVAKGFVTKRFEKLFGRAGIFYQLSQDERYFEEIAKLLQCQPSDLKQPQFRYRELIHSQECALWSFRMSKIFPEAIIVREYDFNKHKYISTVLLSIQTDTALRPDIILMFRGNEETGVVVVAAEIERNPKSKKRLEHKLKKLVSRTLLDGVIYICDSKQIERNLRTIYQSRILEHALRIKQYGENFLLFTDGRGTSIGDGPILYNTQLKPVLFRDWIHNFKTTAVRTRRNVQFEPSAHGC